jgi:hypothetical protein
MTLPPLTAEASLYDSDTYYRTHAPTSRSWSSRRRIRTAQDQGSQEDGGTDIYGSEIINVHGNAPIQCPDGYEQVGNTCAPIDSGSITQPLPVATGGGSKSPNPKHGHGPKRPNPKTGNGINGANYNPAAGGPCYADFGAIDGPPNLETGSYSLNPGGTPGGWACCTPAQPSGNGQVCAFCNPKNGKSAVCGDGHNTRPNI